MGTEKIGLLDIQKVAMLPIQNYLDIKNIVISHNENYLYVPFLGEMHIFDVHERKYWGI